MRSSASTLSGSTNRSSAEMNPNAICASRAARSASASTPSRGSADSTAARIRPSWRLRRWASPARRLWLSASWARTSLPSIGIGWLRSPAETRSTAAEISRSGRTRSRPIAAPARMPTATATANMNSSSREPTCGSTVPVAMSTRPKTPSGTIAAARRVRVSRVWNDRDGPRARVGSRDGVMPAGCPARSHSSSPRAGSRSRAPSTGGAVDWGPLRASGAGAAS